MNLAPHPRDTVPHRMLVDTLLLCRSDAATGIQCGFECTNEQSTYIHTYIHALLLLVVVVAAVLRNTVYIERKKVTLRLLPTW